MMRILWLFSVAPEKYRVRACTAQFLCSRLIWSEKTAMKVRTHVESKTHVWLQGLNYRTSLLT